MRSPSIFLDVVIIQMNIRDHGLLEWNSANGPSHV